MKSIPRPAAENCSGTCGWPRYLQYVYALEDPLHRYMANNELPATFDADDSPTLRRGSMSIATATAFALAALQVGPGLAYSAAYVQGVAGSGSWISLHIATQTGDLPCSAILWWGYAAFFAGG